MLLEANMDTVIFNDEHLDYANGGCLEIAGIDVFLR